MWCDDCEGEISSQQFVEILLPRAQNETALREQRGFNKLEHLAVLLHGSLSERCRLQLGLDELERRAALPHGGEAEFRRLKLGLDELERRAALLDSSQAELDP